MSSKDGDNRFSKLYSDPRFRTLRKVDKTLKIDNRFKSMFTEDKFKLKYSMDKRGKSRKHLIAEDYKKFYRLSDDEDDKKEDKHIEEESDKEINTEEKIDSNLNVTNDETDGEEEEDIKLTHKFGYHRGFNFKSENDEDSSSSSSSSSESECSDEENEEELEHEWGEQDKDAPKIEEATSRIAICNADWDRINAQDIYVLLNSFKSATGVIRYVRVYYSKFGEERLKVEEENGPSRFIFGKSDCVETIDNTETEDDKVDTGLLEEDDDEEQDDDIKDSKSVERLRKYQMERLKYFYAVVECDCKETAEVIYNELDGMEYESSSTTLDIRFIPADTSFDDVKLKEECTSMPTSSTYKAPAFINTALQQSNVKLTWDETDPRRKHAFDKAFEKDNEDDIKAYLATSSSEDEHDEPDLVDIKDDMKDVEKINKYKDLLKSLDNNNDEDYEMELTWEPNLKANAQEMVQNHGNKNSINNSSKSKDKLVNESEDELNEDDSSEDGETLEETNSHSEGSDMSEQSDEEPHQSKNESDKTKSKNKYKKWKKNKKTDTESNDKDSSNLELLMMDIEKNDDKRKHFNYKEIVESYNKKANDDNHESSEKDDFQFDAEDPRFSAIYTSHLYNIDPSDPKFKKTKAFDQIIDKRKRKAELLIQDEKSFQENKQPKKQTNNIQSKSWNTLVRKVKDRTTSEWNVQKQEVKTNGASKFNTNKKFRR